MKMPYGLVLFTVFLVLKLTHVIGWSWWWVCSPLIGWAILLFGYAFVIEMRKAARS